MAKSKHKTDSQDSALEFLRGGRSVPEGLVRRHMAQVKRTTSARLREKTALQREVAKYWGKIQKPISKSGGDEKVKRAVDGLRGISEQLAKRKVSAPVVATEAPGILVGHFVVKVTPPYDYAFVWTEPLLGNPDLAASADQNSGQLSCHAVTDNGSPSPSAGFAYAETGVYFRPIAPATIRVWSAPAVGFSWWTNSLNQNSPVISIGSGGLAIYGQEGSIYGTGSAFQTFLTDWDEEMVQTLRFDFGSSFAGEPQAVEMEVDPSSWYVLFVGCNCSVAGQGWPGSIAGSNMSVTVPSITFEVDLTRPTTQG